MANLNRTRVKICGITRMEDAAAAAAAGADAIGLVFYAGSPRCVSAAQARRIIAGCPPFVATVGLFVDAEPAFVQSVLDEIPLDLLQFHGGESPATCASFRRPYIKAVRVRPGVDIRATAAPYVDAAGILLDTWVEGMAGGTGRRFDWDGVPRGLERPLILAGGLDPGNVAAAIRAVRPFAVDVSGGVEVSPGIKDAGKIAELLAAVRAA